MSDLLAVGRRQHCMPGGTRARVSGRPRELFGVKRAISIFARKVARRRPSGSRDVGVVQAAGSA